MVKEELVNNVVEFTDGDFPKAAIRTFEGNRVFLNGPARYTRRLGGESHNRVHPADDVITATVVSHEGVVAILGWFPGMANEA